MEALICGNVLQCGNWFAAGAWGYVSPEAAAGGPIALVKEGDIIRIDINNKQLELLVEDSILAKRRESFQHPEPRIKTGYMKRYAQMVESASTGAVFRK